MRKSVQRSRWFLSLVFVALALPTTAVAEWYVGPYAGINFADRLQNVQGTGSLLGLQAPDFDLKTSLIYGAKLGTYPGSGWFGIEGDLSHTTPHIKNLDNIPGIHMEITTVAFNLMARYPGKRIQPYAGIGLALLIAHLDDSPTTRSDSDVASAFDALAGIRFFLTPYIAFFTEYKFTAGSLTFNDAFGGGSGFQGDYRAQYVVAGVTYHF
jgi:opacity protein-like surface antigen